MALLITEDCIGCGACEPECPNTAIYEEGAEWNFAAGTLLREVILSDGVAISAYKMNSPLSEEVYFIVPDKCTECTGFHEEPQCAAVCPVDCCVDDPDVRETKEELLAKKEQLHGEAENEAYIAKYLY